MDFLPEVYVKGRLDVAINFLVDTVFIGQNIMLIIFPKSLFG
jgi:hypothetical protein